MKDKEVLRYKSEQQQQQQPQADTNFLKIQTNASFFGYLISEMSTICLSLKSCELSQLLFTL